MQIKEPKKRKEEEGKYKVRKFEIEKTKEGGSAKRCEECCS